VAEAADLTFDRTAVTLLTLRQDGPELDEAAAGALQDAHLDYLAGLHEAGCLPSAPRHPPRGTDCVPLRIGPGLADCQPSL
jgi:hypothetical protein